MSRLPWIIVWIAVAASLGLWLGLRNRAPEHVGFQSIVAYGTSRPLADFDLEASDGGRITRARLQGRPSVLFFGFLNCPDVCPTAMARLAEVDKLLADFPESKRPQYVFITVDPKRDTAAATGEYARHFSPRILGARLDEPELESFARQMSVVYVAEPEVDGVYNVDHSAHFVVLDKDVRIVGIIRPEKQQPMAMAADLRLLAGRR